MQIEEKESLFAVAPFTGAWIEILILLNKKYGDGRYLLYHKQAGLVLP